jgi:hypothetical protein
MARHRFSNELNKLKERLCPCCKKHLGGLDEDKICLRIRDIVTDRFGWHKNIAFKLECEHQVRLQMGEGRFWLEPL